VVEPCRFRPQRAEAFADRATERASRNLQRFPTLLTGEQAAQPGTAVRANYSGGTAVARILVVDDEPDICDAIVAALERAGHVVSVAGDGTTAADLHHQHEFDMIVSDFLMPGLDGIELTRAVRADTRPDIPILLVTASASHADIAEARQAGVSAHLAKPFTLTDLRNHVAALLAAP
jgi:two-component system chemotaxis response regulator CheY